MVRGVVVEVGRKTIEILLLLGWVIGVMVMITVTGLGLIKFDMSRLDWMLQKSASQISLEV